MPYMDSQNAERLVNTYADTILKISYMYLRETHDAEDICQDVFLKLLAKNIQFDDLSHEKAWIIRTSINACKDHLRTAFWKRAVDLREAKEIPAPQKPESALLDLVMTLPKNYRISIYLHYYEGYAVGEIADLLGKSENTISAYLSRGRKKLKAMLTENTNTKGAMRYVQ
ncbi:MAG: sigma-70 family RNA polymerase sigma factor [Lachnospiraceae bacterium]|nr:sigma-70 family RNA polymerase sigma factor [Lachnospiraceae bacterium]